eukprot:gene5307-biopygen4681
MAPKSRRRTARKAPPPPKHARMHDVLGHNDMVVLALSYSCAAALDSVCCVSQQDLLSVLWVVLSKGRAGACACLALELGLIEQLMACYGI